MEDKTELNCHIGFHCTADGKLRMVRHDQFRGNLDCNVHYYTSSEHLLVMLPG